MKNNKDDDESIASSDEEFAEQRNKWVVRNYYSWIIVNWFGNK